MGGDNEGQSRWAITFLAVWTGQAFSLVGSRVATFALVWWLTKSTGSATVLATATMAAMLPAILLGPFAGACVDRWNRRLVMVVADCLIALVSAWLAYLFWVGAMRVWHVYMIMLLRAIGGIFHGPAMMASISLMVPERHLTRVQGLDQARGGALSIVAPPLGALLLSLLPLHQIMAMDVITAAVAVSSLLFVQIPQPERMMTSSPEGTKPSLLEDVGQGLDYIRQWPGMLALLLMAALLNFMAAPAFSLMPLLITRHFGGQALQLGWMSSGWGIGLVLGGLVLSAWGGFRRRIVTTLVGTIGAGLGSLLVGLAPSTAFWLALMGMFLGGTMAPIINGPMIALFQSAVAPEMQGRVFTVLGSLSSAMQPLGLAFAGPVADVLGVRAWFVMSGVANVVIASVAFLVPAIMKIEDRVGGQGEPGT